MRSTRIRRNLAACFLLCGAVSIAQMQEQPARAAVTGTREIAGVVVSEKTGQPVERAELTLRLPGEKDRPPVAQATTDATGQFSFPGLQDGKYSLSAIRSGYVSSRYDAHPGGFYSGIVTGEGLDTSHLRMVLRSYGSIQGTVSEDSGDPVPRAQVSLFRLDPGGSGRMLVDRRISADRMGNYELARLAPGSYFVCASGSPWYATAPRPFFLPDGGSPGGAPRSSLDLVYRITCYPGVTETSQAEPIAVGAGEHVDLLLAMHAVPAIHVGLPVENSPGGHALVVPQLQAEIFGYPESVQSSMVPVRPGASMEITGVPPGRYEVYIPGRDGQPARHGTLDATADHASFEPSSAVPFAAVSGKLAMVAGGGVPSGLSVTLTPQQDQRGAEAKLEANGTFKMQPVRPGDYEVSAYAPESRLFLRQLTAKGGIVRGRVVTIGSEPVTLAVTAVAGIAKVAGMAARSGKPAPGVFVVLVPRDRNLQPLGNQSDSDGSFEFEHVPAGQYTLAAIEDGWALQWRQPEALANYLPNGVQVLVSEASRRVSVKEAVEVQSK